MPDLKQEPGLSARIRSITLNHWTLVSEDTLEYIRQACEDEGQAFSAPPH
jgi:hypothetical protein